MKLEKGNFCPLIQKECIGLECSWFTQLRGTDPNTGKEIDEWGCAVSWLPTLLIENAQKTNSVGASIESFRNEMTKASEMNARVLEATARIMTITPNSLNNVEAYLTPGNNKDA